MGGWEGSGFAIHDDVVRVSGKVQVVRYLEGMAWVARWRSRSFLGGFGGKGQGGFVRQALAFLEVKEVAGAAAGE